MKKVKKLGWIIALSVLSFGIFVACATRDIHDSPIFSDSEPPATVSEDSFSSGTSPNASNSSPSSDAFPIRFLFRLIPLLRNPIQLPIQSILIPIPPTKKIIGRISIESKNIIHRKTQLHRFPDGAVFYSFRKDITFRPSFVVCQTLFRSLFRFLVEFFCQSGFGLFREA